MQVTPEIRPAESPSSKSVWSDQDSPDHSLSLISDSSPTSLPPAARYSLTVGTLRSGSPGPAESFRLQAAAKSPPSPGFWWGGWFVCPLCLSEVRPGGSTDVLSTNILRGEPWMRQASCHPSTLISVTSSQTWSVDEGGPGAVLQRPRIPNDRDETRQYPHAGTGSQGSLFFSAQVLGPSASLSFRSCPHPPDAQPLRVLSSPEAQLRNLNLRNLVTPACCIIYKIFTH